MGLTELFNKSAEKVFSKFKDAVKSATYYSIRDTGFDEDNLEFPVRIIEENFSESDNALSFSGFIQPNDVKGIVLGVDIKSEIHAQSDRVAITQKDSSVKTYTVIAFERDPLSILYTLLLRKT